MTQSGLLQSGLADQAQRRGDATAVVMGEQRLSYGQLDADSGRLARLLVASGVRPGDRVGLLCAKSPAAIVAMLGTLRAGGVYVPLDVASPAARVARILRAAAPGALLVASAALPMLTSLRQAHGISDQLPVGALDVETVTAAPPGLAFGPRDLIAAPDGAPPVHVEPEDPAHILFTSGSTGEPKGVVITHANVAAFLDWAIAHFQIGPEDRLSGHPPLHFDLSTFDVYGALRAGAQLHLVAPDVLLPGQLARFIADSELTQWFSVPSAMTYLARAGALPAEGFASLRRVLWCGEVLPTTVLIQWMRCHPQARFTNLYGPTEATIASSWHAVDGMPADDTAPIPIGTACGGEELLVLDRATGALAGVGEVGELAISGPGLSPGYWRDERRTAEVFIDDPRPQRPGRIYRTGDLGRVDDAGVHHFLGRTDSQIKSRGYRIELGEIETAVDAVPGIAESAVVAVSSTGFEGTIICCAFAATADAALTATTLRARLSAVLPGYMLPSRWAAMEQLPKNVNGKIDRRALREQFASD